jgi:hypothetical protein
MDSVNLCEDRAADQLFDEVIARLYAIAELAPGAQLADAPARVHRALADGATHTVHALRQGSTPDVTHRLALLLWSCGSPPGRHDPWWRTPLGELLAERCQRGGEVNQSAATLESSTA